MTLRDVLLDAEGRLRAGWRLLGHLPILVAAVLGALVLAAVLFVAVLGPPTPLVGLAVQGVVLGSAFVLAHGISGLVLDARWTGGLQRGRLRASRLGGPPWQALRDLGVGGLAGTLALVPAVGIAALGGLTIEAAPLDGARLLSFVAVALALAGAATFEELAFRGYAFQWTGEALGRLVGWGGRRLWGATAARWGHAAAVGVVVAVSSIAFGLAHGGNAFASPLALVNTTLAGLWFAVMVVRWESLWAAIAAHWAWNVVHGLVLGLPVSGVSAESGFDLPTLLVTRAGGPDWLGGGAYGVEGSVGATVALAVAIPLTWWIRLQRPIRVQGPDPTDP